MVPALTNIVRRSGEPIQASLRQAVVAAVAEGQLLPGSELPPSRVLARQLGVARNTITAVYDDLIERGVLTSISRRGVFVSKQSVVTRSPRNCERPEVDWHTRMKIRPTHQRNAFRPSDWQSYPFPFVYGQVDPALFPLADWRSCSRDALARGAVNWWSADRVTLDDPMLIKQITRHILPRRGITANDDEVLITLGSQQAMYLLARLFIGPDTVVGIEEPGYPDLRNVSTLAGGDVRAIPVDDEGLVIGPELGCVGIVFVSPNHQCPTMVTMSNRRRRALLDWAQSRDAIIIEDDYESDLLHSSEHTPALAAQANGRVLYMGTFSKILAPGMRLGYLVAPAPVIAEARALRRLINRNAPLNNQRTAALFIAEGHYDRLVRRLGAAVEARRAVVHDALSTYLPEFRPGPALGGTCVWIRCPEGMAGCDVAIEARNHGVIVERGDFFFADVGQGAAFIRLGLSSIPVQRIPTGVQRLAAAVRNVRFR